MCPIIKVNVMGAVFVYQPLIITKGLEFESP
jgi:hypothetical protein